jgi:catechol 2,3-dioxygenase-like lactoylglutathione lyase family enzyme
MRINRIVPDFQSDNPVACADFYARVLGLRAVMDLGWIVTYASPENPALQISVGRYDASAAMLPDVSIGVDDVHAVHAAAQDIGAEIVHPLTDEAWGVRRFFVRAPDGNVINIVAHPD